MTRFGCQVKPDVNYNITSGEVDLSLGKGASFDPEPIAPEVFRLPEELTRHADFGMAICLDEFQQITQFNGGFAENVIRLAGSQPSLIEDLLFAPIFTRPVHICSSTRSMQPTGRKSSLPNPKGALAP